MGFLLAQVEASPFYGRLAQSARPNRVCFRYGRLCSPSVAPHPASRRRSYGWLQAGVGLPEEDLHLPGQNALTSALGATFVVAPSPRPPMVAPSVPSRRVLPMQGDHKGSPP